MAKQVINVGTAANDKKGDSLRAAFQKVNTNFTELYTALGINADVDLNLGAFEFTGSTMSTTDSSAIVIDQATTITSNLTVGGDLLPSVANGGDLGSSTLPWRSLYVSNNTIFIGGTAVGLDANGNLTTGGTVVGNTPAWANITGKPTIPTSFDRIVNGAHELELLVNGETPYVTFPVVGGGSIIIQGNEIGTDGSGAASIATLSSAESDVKLSANATATNGPRRNWTFGTDGGLQIPGDIRSEGNINIEINLADSTLRRWSFGEDGALTFPDGTSQSTAGGAGGGSTLVNGAYTVSLGSAGILTFPNGLLKIAGNKIRNVNESVGLVLGSEIEVTVDKTVISNGLTDTEGLSNQHIFEVGSTRVFSALQVVNSLSEGGPSLTSQQLTELTSTGFQIGYRVINSLGEGEPLTSFSGWTFGTVGQSQAITFPDGTIQTTAPESFSFSVAADDSTQRAVSNNELVKFIGAGGVTTASDAEGNITINYVQGDIRSEGNINIDINLRDSTLHRWQFGEDGDLTIPGGITGNNDINITVDSGDSSSYTWNFGQTGDLTAPGDITTGLDGLGGRFIQDCADGTTSMRWINMNQGSNSAQLIRAYTGDPKLNTEVERAQIKLNWDETEDKSGLTIRTFNQTDPNNEVDHDWLFKGDGVLQLPQGGVIAEGGGLTGAIRLTPAGGANEYQALLIYPTGAGDGDHIHLTAGGGTTELYLGNDTHYVKLVDGGNVEVRAATGDLSSVAVWTFDTAGNIDTQQALGIKVPNGVPSSVTDIGMTTGSWELNPRSNLATTGGSGSGLTVNITETGGYASAIAIATAGTGYTAGDYITVTSGTSSAAFIIAVAGRNTWLFGEDGNLTFPDATVQTTAYTGGGGTSIPAVVTTGAVGVNGSAHCKVQFTVASATTVTAVGVTAIGVTDSTKGTITLSGSPGTGAFDIVAVTNTTPGEYYILMPFATNASGTGYGAPISGEGTNPCLVRGTLITMADMSRVAVENITYNDDILVWDFDLGEFASAKPLWIKKTQTTVASCLLTFSDHSELQIVGDSPKAHRIFNKEAGKFTYGSMPETPIGTTTFNDQGEEITLISKEWIVGEVEFYNVMTDYHMNLFANSILTSMRYNNLYPITDMKFVKDSRILRTADDYPNVEERLYKGFRLAEQTQSVEEIETHIQWLLTLEVERETECV